MVVEAFQGEETQLQLEGVQFHHMGRVFQHHCSALTVAGNAWMEGELAALEVSTSSCPKLGQEPSKPAWLSGQLTNWIVKCEKKPLTSSLSPGDGVVSPASCPLCLCFFLK